MTLQKLAHKLSQNTIEEFYGLAQYSYFAEVQYKELGLHENERTQFLNQIDWLKSPGHEIIFRLFNQINSYYAEHWAFNHLHEEPRCFVDRLNGILLYKQGKKIGLRANDISFGVRKTVDRLDPIARYKWFYGISPAYIDQVLVSWANAVQCVRPSIEASVILYMALICIHPYFDGNGRAARIFFTWIAKRWNLGTIFMNEDRDGEFLRQGININSTEHLMGMFIKMLCDGYNQVPYLFRETQTPEKEEQAASIFTERMQLLINHEQWYFANTHFIALITHFKDNSHIINYNPRFNSLKEFIK